MERGPIMSNREAEPLLVSVEYDFLSQSDKDDFTTTLIEGGTASATISFLDVNNGVLQIVTDIAATDGAQMQLENEFFKMNVVDKETTFKCRCKIDKATQSNFLVGLLPLNATVWAGFTDGVYFRKDDGDTAIDVGCKLNSSETVLLNRKVMDTEFHTYFFSVVPTSTDGEGQVEFWIDGLRVASFTTAYLPYDEACTLTFAYLNGEAGAATMQIDYIGGTTHRVN